MSPRFRLALLLLLVFLTGAGAHYAALGTEIIGSDPRMLPPLDTLKGRPKMDSARVAAIAKAAYKSEMYGVDSLVVAGFHHGRVGYTLALIQVPRMMGGEARVRVGNAGGACVLQADQ